jgi:aerobic carbon-monoxide dehydrogenase large subunit
MSNSGIGQSVRRVEDFRFITGRGQYTDDISRPRQSHAVFVRSPHAHATIAGIDAGAALRAPGVIGVFTGKDIANDKIRGLICGWMIHSKDGSPMKAGAHPALVLEKVRYVGDHVAVVIAETLNQARDAAELVSVDYDIHAPVVDLAAAQNDGQPQLHPEAPNNTAYRWHLGDKVPVDAAFARAKHTTRLEIVNNRLVPNAMEPRAALGEYDRGSGVYTLHTTSQSPHVARLILSAFIGIAPENKLRVIAPDVGGGFGSKVNVYAEEVVCLWAARKVGRPVKWVADRSESFLADVHGRDHITTAEAAMDATGRILALRVATKANLGAYMALFASAVPTYFYASLLSGQYDIPAIYCEVDAVYTNTTPVDAYRGAGRPEAAFVIERLVEVAARQMGKDPAEFRMHNFIRSFPHQTPVIMFYDAGDYPACMKKALELADYSAFPARKAKSVKAGKLRGIGFSAYVEACGAAPSKAAGSLGAGVGLWESAQVRVNATGSVEVLTGSHSHGQGHETTFAQLVSGRLGIPLEQISIVHGDTDKVQMGMGTYGSRSGPVGLTAISKALDKIVVKAKKIAARCMEVTDDTVDFQDGVFSARGTNKSMAFWEVALQAYVAHKFDSSEIEPGLKETVFHDPPNFTFPAGVHIAEVEIDPKTGVTRIERWTAVDDFGTVINPMIVEGQVHGGVAQGVGQAMLERTVYDRNGQLLTGSFMDYCMPRANDLPSFAVAMTTTPCPSNSLGVKGCGEAGAIAAPAALINAITDALGHENIAMPATPQAVWRAARSSHSVAAQ